MLCFLQALRDFFKSGLPHLIQHVFSDKDGNRRRDAQGDRVARPAVDFDQRSVVTDHQLSEERSLFQVVDLDALELSSQLVDHVRQQVVRERAGRRFALQPTVDRVRFSATDDDGKLALAGHFFQDNDLLILHL